MLASDFLNIKNKYMKKLYTRGFLKSSRRKYRSGKLRKTALGRKSRGGGIMSLGIIRFIK